MSDSIQPKGSSSIVSKFVLNYNPATFEEAKDPRFMEVSAEYVLAHIQPKEFDFLPGRKFIAVDTETFYTGVDSNRLPAHVVRRWIKGKNDKYIPNDFPFCISITDANCSYAVYDTLENKFAEFKKLIPLLTDMSIDKIGHNLDYDMHMLANAGVNMKGRLHDTMILSKLTRANAYTHKLLDIATEFGGVIRFEHMLDSYKAQYKITDYRKFPNELMTQYTCADTFNALLVFENLYPMMIVNNQLKLYDIECQIVAIAYNMERNGIPVDLAVEEPLIKELEEESAAAEKEVYATAGCMFNVNSGQQVYQVLCRMGYGHLVKMKKKTGNPILDAPAIAELAEQGVPIVAKMQEFKKAEKLLNTFARKIYAMRDYQAVLHCNFNTIEARTGRYSVSSPSMQNMPRKSDSRVRSAFIAKPGFTLYDFDFKSQEAIILAHYSRAPYLIDIINSGKDIHKAVAGLIYSLEYDGVSKELRDIAKSVEFAIVYGAGPDKVKVMTGLTLQECKTAIRNFKSNIPEANKFIEDANTIMKKRLYIKTILGRFVYGIPGKEYACVNYVIQGSAADSTKSRMIEIYKYLKGNNYKTRMILQVHDSLLNHVANDEEHILGKLRWLQTERELFRVPVSVDVCRCYPAWRNKEEIKVDMVEPTAEEFEKLNNYNIWAEGLFAI